MRTPEIETALDEIEDKNYSAALRLLTPLAEAGSPEAMCNLATLYQCGWGVEKDGKRAVALYEQVARLDIREKRLSGVALHNLATIYTTGLRGWRTEFSGFPKPKFERRSEGGWGID